MKWIRLTLDLVAAAACLYVAGRILIEGPLIGQICVLLTVAVIVITYWISAAVDRLDDLSKRRFDALREKINEIAWRNEGDR